MSTYQEKLNYYDRAIEACRWAGDLVTIARLQGQRRALIELKHSKAIKA